MRLSPYPRAGNGVTLKSSVDQHRLRVDLQCEHDVHARIVSASPWARCVDICTQQFACRLAWLHLHHFWVYLMPTKDCFHNTAKSPSAMIPRALGGLMVLATFLGAPLRAQGVDVSLVPSIERIRWDDKLAFDEDDLYGGRLALRFGPLIELQPFYFTRDNYAIDSSKAASLFGNSALGKGLDLRHYGANVQFNLGDAAAVPFIRAGAGILRLKPDSAARQDRITVSAGGGLRFGIGGLNAEIFAEQMAFRMNPTSLFAPDSSGTEPVTLRNFVYGAAVTIPLSNGSASAQGAGLQGATAPIEPFVGQLRFDSSIGLEDLEVAGVRAGFDFTPVFGLRGFYWRGVNEDRDGPLPVSGYGGEGQFNLNTGPGISPYIVTGAGTIDFKPNFEDSMGNTRRDRTALIVGGGASFRLTDHLRVNAAVRDYILSDESDLNDVATTGDLVHNTMLTAGLTISFGGASASDQRAAARERDMRNQRNDRTERDDSELSARERDVAERERRLDAAERSMREMRRGNATDADGRYRMSGDSTGRQWITIPVPNQGEVILRYGLPPRSDATGAATTGMPNTIIMRDSSGRVTDSDINARLDEIERRLVDRIDALNRTPAPDVTVNTPQAGAPVAATDDRERVNMPVFRRLSSTSRKDLAPYLGFGSEDGDTQFILGLRADLGPLSAGSNLRFVPELAVGLGGNTSILAMANAQYAFGDFAGERAVRPYLTFGAGIYSPTVLGVNTAFGTSFVVRPSSPLRIDVQLQGINFFNESRLLFGISRGR